MKRWNCPCGRPMYHLLSLLFTCHFHIFSQIFLLYFLYVGSMFIYISLYILWKPAIKTFVILFLIFLLLLLLLTIIIIIVIIMVIGIVVIIIIIIIVIGLVVIIIIIIIIIIIKENSKFISSLLWVLCVITLICDPAGMGGYCSQHQCFAWWSQYRRWPGAYFTNTMRPRKKCTSFLPTTFSNGFFWQKTY